MNTESPDPTADALQRLGWNARWSALFDSLAQEGDVPARVVADRGPQVALESAGGALVATVAGRLRQDHDPEAWPVVGDWVAACAVADGGAVVRAVLPRRTSISRKSAGRVTEGQVLAANVDVALIVVAASARVRARGVERYLTTVWDGGVTPAILVSKVDEVEDVASVVGAMEAIALGVEVVALSNVTGEGVDRVRALLAPGAAAVVLGPSGVGKSTLVNTLSGGDPVRTGEVRADSKGRHTTTHRELHALPGGALLIDTPGLRELQLWHGDEGLSRTFADIEELARECRFTDCAHGAEPGCAVAAAITEGRLAAERWLSYQKLAREVAMVARRADARATAEERRRIRVFSKQVRDIGKARSARG